MVCWLLIGTVTLNGIMTADTRYLCSSCASCVHSESTSFFSWDASVGIPAEVHSVVLFSGYLCPWNMQSGRYCPCPDLLHLCICKVLIISPSISTAHTNAHTIGQWCITGPICSLV